MKREKVTQLKIEESHGEAIVVDDKKSKKEVKKLERQHQKKQKLLKK